MPYIHLSYEFAAKHAEDYLRDNYDRADGPTSSTVFVYYMWMDINSYI